MPLAGNLVLLSGAGANVVAATGPDGLLLVDGGLEKHSKELLKTALQATQRTSRGNAVQHPLAPRANRLQ